MNEQFERGILLGSSTLGLIEVTATCARKGTAGAVDADRLRQIQADVFDDWAGLFQVELTRDVVERSVALAKMCGLRGADSVHLASAVALREQLGLDGGEFAFVTSDLELKAGALRAGVAVRDPQEEAQESADPS